jgi:hypothetical protein
LVEFSLKRWGEPKQLMKITKKYNCRVVVEPAVSTWHGMTDERIFELSMLACRSIADQIRRHVDEVRSSYMDYDQEEVCSHCGYKWAEEPKFPGLNQCCQKEIDEWLEANKENTALILAFNNPA